MEEHRMIYFGIDPGKDGYITAITDNNDVLLSESMPIKKNGEIDGEGIFSIMYEFLNDYVKLPVECDDEVEEELSVDYVMCVEDVHAIGGSAAGATFTFGYNVGVLHSALDIVGVEYEFVQPKEWQGVVWKGYDIIKKTTKKNRIVTDTKSTSTLVAMDLFPDVDLRKNSRCTVPHDGKVDSLLIAEYARRIYLLSEALGDEEDEEDED